MLSNVEEKASTQLVPCGMKVTKKRKETTLRPGAMLMTMDNENYEAEKNPYWADRKVGNFRREDAIHACRECQSAKKEE